jgi:hypothetical protein
MKKIVGAILLLLLTASSALGQIKAADGIDLGTSSTGLSASGRAKIRFNGTAVEQSINGGAWSALGGGGASLPTQTGNSGKYLTTDGSTASWATVTSITWPLTNGTSSNTYTSAIANGASAVGHIFDTTNAFTTNGSKMLSFRTGGTEFAWFDKFNGNGYSLRFPSGTGASYILHPADLLLGIDALTTYVDLTATRAKINSNGQYFQVDTTGFHMVAQSDITGNFWPTADNGYTSGKVTNRWSTVYALTLDSGSNNLVMQRGSGGPYITIQPAITYFAPNGGSAPFAMTTSVFGQPQTDGAGTVGDSTHRFSTVYALAVNSGASTLTYTSGVAASGSATAHVFDTTNTLISGDLHTVWKSGGTEFARLKPNTASNGFTLGYSSVAQGPQLYMDTSSSVGRVHLKWNATDGILMNYFVPSEMEFVVAGSTRLQVSNTAFYPATDNAYNIGKTAQRLATLYAMSVNAGAGQLGLLASAGVQVTWDGFNFYPNNDASRIFGAAGNRWKTIYQGTDAIGTAQTVGVSLSNATAAAAGAQQYSPIFEMSGLGWDSTAVASKAVKFAWQLRPTQFAGNPTGDMVLWQSQNGGAYSEAFSIRMLGGGTIPALYNSNATGAYLNGSTSFNFVVNNADVGNLSATAWKPQTDNATTLGASATRWSTVYALTVSAGSSILQLQTGAGGGIFQQVNGSNIGIVKSTGFHPGADNTYSLGENSTPARWSTVYALALSSGTSDLTVNANATINLQTGGSTRFTVSGNTLFPNAGNTQFIGSSIAKMAQVWSYQFCGTLQTVAAASSTTIDPTSGETARVTLSATAITTLTINAGQAGQVLTVEVVQDGTGGRAIPTTWTNVLFAGGSYTATATASKRDAITLRYDSTDAKWVELSRAMNQ